MTVECSVSEFWPREHVQARSCSGGFALARRRPNNDCGRPRFVDLKLEPFLEPWRDFFWNRSADLLE